MNFKHLNGVGEGLGSVSVTGRTDKWDQPSCRKQPENLDKTFFFNSWKVSKSYQENKKPQGHDREKTETQRHELSI